MNDGSLNTRAAAATQLSTYLSLLFRAQIIVPPELADYDRATKPFQVSIAGLLGCLPQVYQQAVDGAKLVFALPLVASGKGTSFTPAVANVVNEMIEEVAASGKTSDKGIEVPTFFYSDGSTMVIKVFPTALGSAITILTESKQARNFVSDAILSLRA